MQETVGETKQLLEENAPGSAEKDTLWNAQEVQAESDVHLEDDQSIGNTTVIRLFEFSANPEAFCHHTPTKQELFNAHYRLIDSTLWRDGLKVVPEINPTVTFNKRKTKYRIFVTAQAQRGQTVLETPQTLSQLAHVK
jgi:hypothetical protein